MNKAVYVGLSGPTYYDYSNTARKSENDWRSSPNPILENAFGLAVFYDEIWFLCESLCPQSLRGHPKVRYVDLHLDEEDHKEIRGKITLILEYGGKTGLPSDEDVTRDNFKRYKDGILRAGVGWGATGALDNHTHELRIMHARTYADSNRIICMYKDLEILKQLRRIMSIDISLNSFGQNLYKLLVPSQHDPAHEISKRAQLGSYVINARVHNLVDIRGPDASVFEKIYDNEFVKDFRQYLLDRDVESAAEVYVDVINEIDHAIKEQVRKAARNARPVKGLVNVAVDAMVDYSGLGTIQKVGEWYLSSVSTPSLGAAAFLLDLK